MKPILKTVEASGSNQKSWLLEARSWKKIQQTICANAATYALQMFWQNRINILIPGKYRFSGNPVIDQPIFGYRLAEPAAVLPVNINRLGT